MSDEQNSAQPKPGDAGADTATPQARKAAGKAAAEADASTDLQMGDLNRLLSQMLKQRGAGRQKRDVWYFLSSGVFFMIVGSVALLAAFMTMGTTHASFTFVLVVVGVAILLYGTGTQGAGNFESTAGEMNYKVGVAGGAGILAFAVGLGIVIKANDIRDAFQIERKYARLVFRDPGDGVGKLTDYVPEISVDGVPIPSQRSGEYIIAYVPFVAGLLSREIQISANFYYVGTEQSRNKLLSPKVSVRQIVPLTSDEITTDDAGFDFPRLKPDVVVKLVIDDVLNDPDASQIAAVGGSTDAPPPPVVQAFQ